MDILVDIAEVVGALATAMALLFIAKATSHSRQTLEESQRMRRIETERDDRAIAAEERRQASRIAFWPVKLPTEDQAKWGIELVNTSEASIYDLEVVRNLGKTKNGGEVSAIKATAKTLPPGQYLIRDESRWPTHCDMQQVLERVTNVPDRIPTVRFADSDGRRWVRNPDGRLERDEQPVDV